MVTEAERSQMPLRADLLNAPTIVPVYTYLVPDRYVVDEG